MVYLCLLNKYIINDLAEIILNYLDTFCALCGRTFIIFDGYLVNTGKDYQHGECKDCCINRYEIHKQIDRETSEDIRKFLASWKYSDSSGIVLK